MAINANKPDRWKADIQASVDLFNNWFLEFAPKAYRDTRVEVTKQVEASLRLTSDLRQITPEILRGNPSVLPTLRMSTCPPVARDRLVGIPEAVLQKELSQIGETISKMLDEDVFPWIAANKSPTDEERYRASTIVADRLCGAVSNPIIRNAQEKRQLALIRDFLIERRYKEQRLPSGKQLAEMESGTFSFRMNVKTDRENIPIDAVIQPKEVRPDGIPILIEAKSADLKETYGPDTQLILFLCGYFDSGYLGYEAAEGIDWIWEHRLQELEELGL